MAGDATTKRLGGASGPRSDLPLFLWSVLGFIVAGVIIFFSVDAAMQSEAFDSNSPNATTPGPDSSFNIR